MGHDVLAAARSLELCDEAAHPQEDGTAENGLHPPNFGFRTVFQTVMSPATVTPERTESPAPRPPAPEKPVFAATSQRRPRALKLLGRFAAGLVGLWLVALVLGSFGFGEVPGIQLPRIVGHDPKPAAQPRSVKLEQRTPDPSSAAPAAVRSRAESRARPARRLTSRPANGDHPISQTPAGRQPTRGGGTSTPSVTSTPGPSSPAPASQATPPPSSSPSPQASPNATPPGSSSTTPGSRSQSGTAPGRDHSGTSPTPGSGNGHGRPTG
jgi:hypothetical protein